MRIQLQKIMAYFSLFTWFLISTGGTLEVRQLSAFYEEAHTIVITLAHGQRHLVFSHPSSPTRQHQMRDGHTSYEHDTAAFVLVPSFSHHHHHHHDHAVHLSDHDPGVMPTPRAAGSYTILLAGADAPVPPVCHDLAFIRRCLQLQTAAPPLLVFLRFSILLI